MMSYRIGLVLLAIAAGAGCATNRGAYVAPLQGPTAQVRFSHDSSVPGMGVSYYEGDNCINPAIMRATDRPDDPTVFKLPADRMVSLFVRTGVDAGFGKRGWYCVIGSSFQPQAGARYRFQLSRRGNQCRLLAEQLGTNGKWRPIEAYRLRTYRTPVVASDGFCEPLDRQ